MSEKLRGNVKWFNDAKGFGFIENPNGDVFVHYSVIESAGFKTLKDGEEVEYQLEQGDKGLHAKNVIRLSAPATEEAPVTSQKSNGLASQIEVTRIDNSGIESPAQPQSSMTTSAEKESTPH